MSPGPDPMLAGELLRAALTPRANPREPGYQAALAAWLSDPAFRELVDGVARGLGLRVVEGSERGLVLAPAADSLFGFASREFRPATTTAQARLLDGLFMLAIVTTCYPRAADLADDPRLTRPPITVDQVARVLLEAAARVRARAPVGDLPPDAEEQGLEPVWRELGRIPEAIATADGRAAPRSLTQRIRRLLDRLTELGAFSQTTVAGEAAWQPTYRWAIQVQEYAASAIWEDVQRVLGPAQPVEG